MADHDDLIKALDAAHWEMGEGFQGLPDEDVWKRPDPRLLSVGELASHVAYWEAQSFVGEALDSPLFARAARYYTTSIGEPVAQPLGAEAVFAEVKRVHEACKSAFLTDLPELQAVNALRGNWTWAYTLQYQAFHAAYHTGQIYSVRHLLGHSTPDN